MSLIAERVVAVEPEYTVIFGPQVGGSDMQFCARLKRAQDMTARDDSIEMALINYWQLIHVLTAHRFQRVGHQRI